MEWEIGWIIPGPIWTSDPGDGGHLESNLELPKLPPTNNVAQGQQIYAWFITAWVILRYKTVFHQVGQKLEPLHGGEAKEEVDGQSSIARLQEEASPRHGKCKNPEQYFFTEA